MGYIKKGVETMKKLFGQNVSVPSFGLASAQPWSSIFRKSWVSSLLLACLGLAMGTARAMDPRAISPVSIIPSAMTAQVGDRPVAFMAPPRLNRAYANRQRVGEAHPTYYLTFQLPEGAAVPLTRLMVELSEGRRDFLFHYQLEATVAFVGTPESRGESIDFGELSQDRQRKSITLDFEPAIAPGQVVTVGLKPERNPRFPGTYLFRVTGFPSGDLVAPSFMGYARLGFYDTDQRGPIFR
ncbi:hypothetical protein C7271_19855 [filamentous cyanobacterium CCP5]|nr:hypothetical protein C7271_19855 [filamentous cyanobacterium CCP5]